MTQTMTEVDNDTETLDVTKLTWQRPTHINETLAGAPKTTPWKALCGAILYDIIPTNQCHNHQVCERCHEIFLDIARRGEIPL